MGSINISENGKIGDHGTPFIFVCYSHEDSNCHYHSNSNTKLILETRHDIVEAYALPEARNTGSSV